MTRLDKSSTNLNLGPLNFKHQVQKIAIQEVKSVDSFPTSRTNRNFISDPGESRHVCQIRLLFTGLDEINAGVRDGPNGTSGIRGLIALFRTCPITSVKNGEISVTWKNNVDDELIAQITKDTGDISKDQPVGNASKLVAAVANSSGSKLDRLYKIYSKYIPCSFDSIHLENVPEIPYSIQVTISISRSDVSPYFNKDRSRGALLYAGKVVGSNSTNPSEAYWLKKWMYTILEDEYKYPRVHKDSFDYLKITKHSFQPPVLGEEAKVQEIVMPLTTSDSHKGGSVVLGESSSISNKFSYKHLAGHGWCAPAHMGVTSRTMSLDIVFNNQESREDFEKFCEFKEASDKIVKLKEVSKLIRLEGWHISSPISRLLGINRKAKNTIAGEMPFKGIYVPMSMELDTSDIPSMLNCRINLVENNVDFIAESLVRFSSERNEKSELKAHFDTIVKEQIAYKKQLLANPQDLESLLDGDGRQAYSLYFPVAEHSTKLKQSNTFALLNKDTLRAVLLNKYIQSKNLRRLLSRDEIATSLSFDKNSTFVSSLGNRFGKLVQAFAGADDPKGNVLKACQNAAQEFFSGDADYDDLAALIYFSLVGNFTGSPIMDSKTATTKLISKIKNNEVKLTQSFNDELFKQIIERKSLSSRLSNAYDVAGVHDAYYLLLLNYQERQNEDLRDKHTDEEVLEKEILDNGRTLGTESLYPDLDLPTYFDLYGNDWKDFAPTFDDFGIDVGYNKLKSIPAVAMDTPISPAAWFFIERKKEELRERSKIMTEAVNTAKGKLTVSLPFNTESIKKLQKIYKKETPSYYDKSLGDIIKSGLLAYRKQDTAGFKSFERDVFAAFDGTGSPIKLYWSHEDNEIIEKEIDLPGLGGHIFNKLKAIRQEQDDKDNKESGADESSSSYRNEDISFRINTTKSNEQVVASSIAQIQDDFFSPERMFPTAKIYLIDRRGDEIVGDSSLFSVSALISVDVTLDKHDAPLALIKIADPLFILQNASIPLGNKETKEGKTYVKASLTELERDEFIKSYKILQGRAVQIRLGYASTPFALPIIFTGRITEIQHGNELIVVAQGWKAELHGRQITFANSSAKSWGPRDLAIQTIEKADPDGIGTKFSPYEYQVIRDSLSKANPGQVRQALQNQTNVDGQGQRRSVTQTITNYLGSFLNLSSGDGLKGLDLRLKNIWYPDTKLYSNVVGWRSWGGMMPTYVSDGWIVPLQPAWNVLEEAARHAWNTVVEVVPYDTEATLFMGHPDQPYYYKSPSRYLGKVQKRFLNEKQRDYLDNTYELISIFQASSSYYSNRFDSANQIYRSAGWAQEYDYGAAMAEDLTPAQVKARFSGQSFLSYINSYLDAAIILDDSKYFVVRKSVIKDQSTIRLAKEAASSLSTNKLLTILFQVYFDASIESMRQWTTSEGDIAEILGSGVEYQDNPNQGIDAHLQDAIKEKRSNVRNAANKKIEELIGQIDGIRKSLKKSRGEDLLPGAAFGGDLYKQTSKFTSADFTRIATDIYKILDELPVTTDKTNTQESVDDVKQKIKANIINVSRGIDVVNEEWSKLRLGEKLWEGSLSAPGNVSILGADTTKLTSSLGTLQTLILYKQLRSPIVDAEGRIGRLFSDISSFAREDFNHVMPFFKAFVYYFCNWVLADDNSRGITANRKPLVSTFEGLPPDMKVFRVHHFASDSLNIICNKITATTSEMWNTVVIEHPSQSLARALESGEDEPDIGTSKNIITASDWVYWPSSEVTGVQGLQFHPGVSLANKKVRSFTELNCQSQDLAAKLACNHLAEGIRKMYRGNLCMLGKHIKPHDRIVVADNYSKISGPIGVESVVHHYNVEDGWITNIKPEAVSDANSSASILQTAALAATYESVFNAIDFAADIAFWAVIIGSFGAATPGAIAGRAAKKGLLSALKRTILNPIATSKVRLKGAKKVLIDTKNAKGLIASAITIGKSVGGPVGSIVLSQLLAGFAKVGTDFAFKAHVIAGFVQDYRGEGPRQLPVVISPLMHNNAPFTAGLEMNDSLWQIGSMGTFYSIRQLREHIIQFSEEMAEGGG
jgi:hypothetical protein